MKKLYYILAFMAAIFLFVDCGNASPEGTKNPFVKVSVSEKTVNCASGSFEVYVSSNTSWTVTAQTPWLKVSRTEGKGNMSIVISYEENYKGKDDSGVYIPGDPRTGTVRISAEGTIPARVSVKQTSRTFRNPIFRPMPDPYVWREDHGNGAVYYYAVKSNGSGVNLGKSNKLTNLGGTKEVWHLPKQSGSVPVWNRANLWAPEMFRIDGVWYIYYAAGWPSSESKDKYGSDYHTQRTGVIRNRAEDPTTGTWEDIGMIYTGDEYVPGIKATVDNAIYAIDMTTFELNGQRYAVWSGNVSHTDGKQRIYIATMENPWTINSNRVEISRPDMPWEKWDSSINEGPSVIINEKAGKLFVVYSSNGSWTSKYNLSWIMLDMNADPMNPDNWTKSKNYVFWRCDNVSKNDNPNNRDEIGGVHGVGHNTFTKSPDGTEDWIVYHVKRYKENGWDNRDCFIQKFTWNEDGTPNFGTPVGYWEEIEVPSGEPL